MTAYKGKTRRRVEIRDTNIYFGMANQHIGRQSRYTDLARYCFAVGLKLSILIASAWSSWVQKARIRA